MLIAYPSSIQFRFFNSTGPNSVSAGAFSAPCTPYTKDDKDVKLSFFSGREAGDYAEYVTFFFAHNLPLLTHSEYDVLGDT